MSPVPPTDLTVKTKRSVAVYLIVSLGVIAGIIGGFVYIFSGSS